MTNHNLQLSDPAPLLVAPGPGTAPAPALDDVPLRQNGRLPYVAVPPEFALDGPSYLAQLTQVQPASGQRGWSLTVCQGGNGAQWPRRMLSRPGLRPPTLTARLDALRKLGFEPEHTGDNWCWQETTSLIDGGRHVLLWASLIVRAIPPAAADIGVAVDVPAGVTA